MVGALSHVHLQAHTRPMTAPDWMTEFQDYQTLCAHTSGEYIRFYLTTGHTGVSYTHSQLPEGADLPRYSCRLITEDGELVLTITDWRDRLDEVGPTVRDWIRAHITLRGCALDAGRYQGDPYWRAQLLRDNE